MEHFYLEPNYFACNLCYLEIQSYLDHYQDLVQLASRLVGLSLPINEPEIFAAEVFCRAHTYFKYYYNKKIQNFSELINFFTPFVIRDNSQ